MARAMQSTLEYETPAEPPGAAAPARGRYVVLALLCAAAAIAYVQRSAIAVAAAPMQGSLKIDKQQFGVVLASWALGYALMQVPSGWLADRL